MTLEVSVVHRFPGTAIDVAFTAPGQGVTALFGPSGAGKSTVLAALAGLFRPERARVALDGAVMADTARGIWLPPERRRVGLVFQDARLFPHMSVRTNLRYGARRAAPGPVRFDDVVELLALGPLLGRRPRSLSGGERQRVAIGRALLAQPRLLLMDEPLASLDAARKAEIIPFLLRLHAAVPMPTVYVTHALAEVVQLATHLVLLQDGRAVASGALTELAGRADLPLASRPDAAAVLEAVVTGHEPARGLTRLMAGTVPVLVPHTALAPGTAVRLRVPAQEVVLAGPALDPGLLSIQNVVPGRVGAVVADAATGSALVGVEAGGRTLLSRVTMDAVARLGLRPGVPVLALVKAVAIEVLPRAGVTVARGDGHATVPT